MEDAPESQIQTSQLQDIIHNYAQNAQDPKMGIEYGDKKKSSKINLPLNGEALFHAFFSSFISLQLPNNSEQSPNKTEFIRQYITPLNNKHSLSFTSIVREELINKLKDNPQFHKKTINILLESIAIFVDLMKNFRDCSVTFPIVEATYLEFELFWLETKNKADQQIFKKQLIKKWKYVPYQLFQQFLTKFEMLYLFQSNPINQFLQQLSSLLFENKIQMTCEYYRIFKLGRTPSEQTHKILDNFQYSQIIPRITKKDQIFTQYVINIIKGDASIAAKVFRCIDIKQYQKIIHLTGTDIHQHPKIIQLAMRRHYYDIRKKSKEWYIIEDKLSYSPIFLQWFASDIVRKLNREPSSDSQGEVTLFGITNLQEGIKISESILFRAGLLKQIKCQQIKNPLYQKDDFIPAQFILNKSENQQNNYLQLNKTDQIVFIDQIDQHFNKAIETLNKAEIVGFDSQFWATTSKYQNGGISIIQLSTETQIYIFDYYHLLKHKQFQEFLISFMENQNIIKVGHTVSSDFQFLYKNFKKQINVKNMIDLTHLFKKKYPNEVYSSLAFMCDKVMHKKMCKYEQRSNWNRRPLKKTQLYYASLDAYICVFIYKKLITPNKCQQTETVTQIKKKQATEIVKQPKKQFHFDYIKFEQYLKDPIFLVDNMLKRLCSTMRNVGLDAQYIAVKDYELAINQALKQKRIIITRDSKLIQNKYSKVPIYLIREKGDSDIMFNQIKDVFDIDLGRYTTLSRCVKCNNSQLLVISTNQAKLEIKFTYDDSNITVFWRCSKCKQIYWEGGQFKKAKDKYNALKQND